MLVRTIVLIMFGMAAAGPALAERPYAVSLIGGTYEAEGWRAGLRIVLAEGWKTYWRMPGEAGIPPQFSWQSSRPMSVEVEFPLPSRFSDASGETVGYVDEVVFPFLVRTTADAPLDLDLDLFFAVCRDVCIPAQLRLSRHFETAAADPEEGLIIAAWQARVPRAAEPVESAVATFENGRAVLRLKLHAAADDVFVESEEGAYFRKPVFTDGGRTATLMIDNLADPARLGGKELLVTVSEAGMGLEQRLTLP
jgi:DsbC/DsbD-like thiol-disulfide interchange protein